jgi:NAD(P)-dependent dehydrogenase (short-subunit alcohol dehydrogenase family)
VAAQRRENVQRIVAITGVAGGIGGAAARVFRAAGWTVVGVDRREDAVDGCCDHFIRADVSDADAPRQIFDAIEVKFGQLDALVNNAACQICKPLIETTAFEWDKIFGCNVRSIHLSVAHAYPMLKRSRGSIVNVSSVHAVATSKGIGAYAASKGALLALTRAMALEFGEDGVRANAVLPGAVNTPMLHAGLSRGQPEGEDVDKLIRGLGRKHVMGRVGNPCEIGQAILFLADGDRSSFVTGQSMIVDGGATARLSTE